MSHEGSPEWTEKEKKKSGFSDCQKIHFQHTFWLQKYSLYIVDICDFFQWISVENTSIQSSLPIFFCVQQHQFFLRGVLRKSWQERYMQLAFMYVFRCLSQRVRRIGGKCGKSWTWSKINPHFVTFSICYTEATIKRCKNCGDQNPS